MDKCVESIHTVADSLHSVDAAVCDFLSAFMTVARDHNVDMTQATTVINDFTCRTKNLSSGIVSALDDLCSMSKATKSLLYANFKEAFALLLNILNVFLKQLMMHFGDLHRVCRRAEVLLNQLHLASQNVETIDTSSDTTAVRNIASSLGDQPLFCNESTSAVMDEGVKKGYFLNKNMRASDCGSDASVLSLSAKSPEKTGDLHNVVDEKKNFFFQETTKNERVQRDWQQNACKLVSDESKGNDIRDTPYLCVVSTVEDALGSLVMSNRPKLFTAPEIIEQWAPIATYYIKLPVPGCLEHLVFVNYLALKDNIQADLMCDLLQTEDVKVFSFVSPAGEVVTESLTELKSIPACGWRVASSKDRHRVLYTFYVLVERVPSMLCSLLIQETIVIGSYREEVMHEITPLTDAPEFAKVTVRGFCSTQGNLPPATTGYTSDSLSAILQRTKNIYEKNGFLEMCEDEILMVAQQRRLSVQQSKDELLTGADTTVNVFGGTALLASLEQPSGEQSWGFGDVAKGAMRGAAAVVLAPVSVGKVVGSAVLDVSGVTGAIKSQRESLFRKSFPLLRSEEIIGSFNCALMVDDNTTPSQGIMFLTQQWLCFHAGITNVNISLEWDEIKNVEKQRSAKGFKSAITVHTHVGTTYFFVSFLYWDDAYTLMMNQWLRR